MGLTVARERARQLIRRLQSPQDVAMGRNVMMAALIFEACFSLLIVSKISCESLVLLKKSFEPLNCLTFSVQ